MIPRQYGPLSNKSILSPKSGRSLWFYGVDIFWIAAVKTLQLRKFHLLVVVDLFNRLNADLVIIKSLY